jgi:hypothetical protein
MSDAGRYAEAVATLGYRVTIGKSAIHGWGAFAKRRHAARESCHPRLPACRLSVPLAYGLAWSHLSHRSSALFLVMFSVIQIWQCSRQPCCLPSLHADMLAFLVLRPALL